MDEPMKRVRREALVMLIEGLIEDTRDFLQTTGDLVKAGVEYYMERKVLGFRIEILGFRIERIEKYLSGAEIYALQKRELEGLRSKYDSLKARIGDFK